MWKCFSMHCRIASIGKEAGSPTLDTYCRSVSHMRLMRVRTSWAQPLPCLLPVCSSMLCDNARQVMSECGRAQMRFQYPQMSFTQCIMIGCLPGKLSHQCCDRCRFRHHQDLTQKISMGQLHTVFHQPVHILHDDSGCPNLTSIR